MRNEDAFRFCKQHNGEKVIVTYRLANGQSASMIAKVIYDDFKVSFYIVDLTGCIESIKLLNDPLEKLEKK